MLITWRSRKIHKMLVQHVFQADYELQYFQNISLRSSVPDILTGLHTLPYGVTITHHDSRQTHPNFSADDLDKLFSVFHEITCIT
jgi:hypothetical protein